MKIDAICDHACCASSRTDKMGNSPAPVPATSCELCIPFGARTARRRALQAWRQCLGVLHVQEHKDHHETVSLHIAAPGKSSSGRSEK
jgi:hypothetical protein